MKRSVFSPMPNSDPDWPKFFGDEGVWRNDWHKGAVSDDSTISTVMVFAEDRELDQSKDMQLGIRHVRQFPNGKGFVPFTYRRATGLGSGILRGEMFRGTSQDVYDKALIEGRKLLSERQQQEENEREEYRIRVEKLREHVG